MMIFSFCVSRQIGKKPLILALHSSKICTKKTNIVLTVLFVQNTQKQYQKTTINGQTLACTVGVQRFLARIVTHLLIISVCYYLFCFVLFSSPIQLFTWVVRIINLGTLMNNMNNYPLIFLITGLRGQIIQAKILPFKGAQRPINIFMSLGQGQKALF